MANENPSLGPDPVAPSDSDDQSDQDVELPKPKTKQDLRPPFEAIGDAGWDTWLRHLLKGYGIESGMPLPPPTPEDEIRRCEARLGVPLPTGLKLLLQTFGPLQFEWFCVVPAEEIDFMSQVLKDKIPLRFKLTPAQKRQCKTIVAVAR